ncbi:MAG: hypothetical protein M1836_004310 [Candelina mexicana]|nr:MAG: hypothetical protein M1836_004310 [Candelina mexicana]
MTSPRSRQPMNWEDYDHGDSSRRGSGDSGSDQARFDDSSPASTSERLKIPKQKQREESGNGDTEQDLRRQRQLGGVNSIENFARSWQRAAGFYELTPRRDSSRHSFAEGYDESGEARHPDGREDSQPRSQIPRETRSLLHEQLQSQEAGPESEIRDDTLSGAEDDAADTARSSTRTGRTSGHDAGIFPNSSRFASPFGGSYGASYGTLASRVNESSMRHAGRLFQEQQAVGSQEPDKEREPLLVKRVTREDGQVVNVVVGQSTLPQTVFNSVNVLIGVGLLSLPLGIKYSGWLIGLLFLTFAAITTSYTAKILAKCLDVDNALITFADLAYASFGHKARIATSVLFSVELVATCVALIVLFSDAFDALIPGFGAVGWKVVCGIIIIPLNFLPLRILSFSSALGILCCMGSKYFSVLRAKAKSDL